MGLLGPRAEELMWTTGFSKFIGKHLKASSANVSEEVTSECPAFEDPASNLTTPVSDTILWTFKKSDTICCLNSGLNKSLWSKTFALTAS